METNIYHSDLAIHPGEFLQEILEEIGMSQVELSNRIGRPTQAINEIIKGKKSITSKTALELEDVLKVPAHVWIGLESEYQVVKAKAEEQEQMQEETKLLKNFPYADLVKLKFVKQTRKAIEKVDELKRFFGVAKLAQIPEVKVYQPAFRVSNHKQVSHEAIATWLQAGRLKAKEIETKTFDKNRLKEVLDDIKKLMLLTDINQSIDGIRSVLASCGIAFVILPHFKGTKVHGATFWLDEKDSAVILMTIRGAYSDIFWFSLFHEIGHIVLHQKREVFLEDGYSDPALQKQEDEANQFARNFLIPREDFKTFIEKGELSKKSILEFTDILGVKPSVVVGRLMYEKMIDYKHPLNRLRDQYKWA